MELSTFFLKELWSTLFLLPDPDHEALLILRNLFTLDSIVAINHMEIETIE